MMHRSSYRLVNHGRRAGVSVIEVVIIVAIVGLLLALTVPALQSLRESSRRVECLNRLRQIGVSLASHHEQTGAFPVDGENGWGFAVYLLPSLDQNALYTELSPATRSREAAEAAGSPGFAAVLPTLVCPAFSSETRLPNGRGRSNYIGSASIFAEQTRKSDVYDGEGQTIAAGETVAPHAWIEPGMVTLQGANSTARSFESRHSGVTHFLFCDGTVRGISNDTDSTIFAALLTPAGREAIGEF